MWTIHCLMNERKPVTFVRTPDPEVTSSDDVAGDDQTKTDVVSGSNDDKPADNVRDPTEAALDALIDAINNDSDSEFASGNKGEKQKSSSPPTTSTQSLTDPPPPPQFSPIKHQEPGPSSSKPDPPGTSVKHHQPGPSSSKPDPSLSSIKPGPSSSTESAPRSTASTVFTKPMIVSSSSEPRPEYTLLHMCRVNKHR